MAKLNNINNNIYDVIQSPCMTLKAKVLNEKQSQIVIFVLKSANKIQIKQAVERIFGVGVSSVNTMISQGKTKIASRRYTFFKKDTKKAIVTFKDKNFAKQLSSASEQENSLVDYDKNNNEVGMRG